MQTIRNAFCIFIVFVSLTPSYASDKADIDTSPRVFASPNGKYWVRVTTIRDMGEVNRWTTTLTVSHADGGNRGYADEKVISETKLDIFPAQVLVSNQGIMTFLGHFGEVSLNGVFSIYGPDGKKRGTIDYMEFLEALPGGGSGSDRAVGYQWLREGRGAYYEYFGTRMLVLPLPGGREARINLETGKAVK